jgi:hypothetical protein
MGRVANVHYTAGVLGRPPEREQPRNHHDAAVVAASDVGKPASPSSI